MCLAAAFASNLHAANSVPQVAVLPFEAGTISVSDSRILQDALATEILGSGQARVLERAQVDKILAEQGFQESGACDRSDCAVKAGQMLGIDRVVVGSVGRLGTTWVLSARLVDVASGEVLKSSTRKQDGPIEALLAKTIPQVRVDLVGETSGAQRKAWYWGGGALLVAGGAGLATYLLLREDPAPAPSPSISNPAADDLLVRWRSE